MHSAIAHVNNHGFIIPVGITGLLSWSVWLLRFVVSRTYRPLPDGFTSTTSVVVPSFREDPDIVMRCLQSWLAEDPTEVVVVPDVEDLEVIERLNAVGDTRLRVRPIRHTGKRSALAAGIRASTSEILVLTDSDTMWRPGLLKAVQAPFEDPAVGGVGTRQSAFQAMSSTWRRVADWLIDIRYLDYVPAQSRVGAIACLSGRTAAYRRAAVMPVLPHLVDEFFLGRRCIAGDDGRLTWLVLAAGWKTRHQSSAHAESMFPSTFRAFLKQRVRWSRNSYRCYLTAMWKGWLWRQPLLTQLSVIQVMLTPVTMGIAVLYFSPWLSHPHGREAVYAVVWLLGGRALRGISHLRHRPADIVLLPLVVLMTIFIALPVKTYAFLTMNSQGWLTRDASHMGGEGQTAATLQQA